MQETVNLTTPWYITVLHALKKFFTNRTFIYIVRRILSSFITLLILVAIVALLIRLLPDDKFYSVTQYENIIARSGEKK